MRRAEGFARRNPQRAVVICRSSHEHGCESGVLRTLERAGDAEGATRWRWLVKEQEPDIAGRHASLPLQILSYAVTDDTKVALM